MIHSHTIHKTTSEWIPDINVYACSVILDSVIPWTGARQDPLFTELSRQEYWNGLSFPTLGDLPNPGIKLESPASQADSLPLSHQESNTDINVSTKTTKALEESIEGNLYDFGLDTTPEVEYIK